MVTNFLYKRRAVSGICRVRLFHGRFSTWLRNWLSISRKSTYKVAYTYAWRIVYRGLTYISLGFNHSIIIAIIIEVIAGICIAFFSVHNTTHTSTISSEQYDRASIFSAIIFILSTMPLGVLVGGILSEMWGVRALYLIIGAIICVTSLIGMLLPYFKFLDEAIERNQHNSKN